MRSETHPLQSCSGSAEFHLDTPKHAQIVAEALRGGLFADDTSTLSVVAKDCTVIAVFTATRVTTLRRMHTSCCEAVELVLETIEAFDEPCP
ncbi:putative Transcription factor Pcc1 [Giardia muris]|uniref:Putative Transcription factor Pcc1 n=1 Tax=Giardia muris TaxID=5742 RepID=A0A4Z1SSI1_GIAMU|nr:putative Transcription factor Pcc1 [Giardia muris]|eukprot:TNJ27935.1 putative Transcription factor Pcc1 [Giardia muris]